jgi:peptidoglycan/LPS O-acetylase OafA/YrhL
MNFAICLSLATLIALASYKYIEMPAQKWLRGRFLPSARVGAPVMAPAE